VTVAAALVAPVAPTGWHGHLALRYRREGGRTVSHDRHHGPLRVLQSLYPEGADICHHVLVHAPGGIVGGDRLEIDAHLDAGCHALITTPSATRFYRSAGAVASQSAQVTVAAGARLEWLPLETIAYRGCLAQNQLRLTLEPGAEAMGWDVLALGLPASGQAFDHGHFVQHLELPGVWLERGRIDAADTALMNGPVGLAGRRVLATLWFAAGEPLATVRRQGLLDSANEVVAGDPLAATAGVTSTHASVVVLRVLADRVEPAMALLARVRAAWRRQAWALDAHPPRIWKM
jgi:urease accessory protein